jgi:hypothetical protein
MSVAPETQFELQTRVESQNFNFSLLQSLTSSIFDFFNLLTFFNLRFLQFSNFFNFRLQFFDFLKSSGS